MHGPFFCRQYSLLRPKSKSLFFRKNFCCAPSSPPSPSVVNYELFISKTHGGAHEDANNVVYKKDTVKWGDLGRWGDLGQIIKILF